MAWIVWGSLGAVVLGCLAVSWWFDRDARRRGAAVRSSGEMWTAARRRRWEVTRETAQQSSFGATPRAQDQLRAEWRGRSGR